MVKQKFFGKEPNKSIVICLKKKYGQNILLTYGQNSIKKNGIYNKIIDLLSDFSVYECGNIKKY